MNEIDNDTINANHSYTSLLNQNFSFGPPHSYQSGFVNSGFDPVDVTSLGLSAPHSIGSPFNQRQEKIYRALFSLPVAT